MSEFSDVEVYRRRLAVRLYETVYTFSKGDADLALIRSGAAFEALMMVASLVVAGTPEFKDPQAIRLFCESACKKLRRDIAAIRAEPDSDRLFGETYDPSRLS